jgi:hypothetical protein
MLAKGVALSLLQSVLSALLAARFSFAGDQCFELREVGLVVRHDFGKAAAPLPCEQALQFLLTVVGMVGEIHALRQVRRLRISFSWMISFGRLKLISNSLKNPFFPRIGTTLADSLKPAYRARPGYAELGVLGSFRYGNRWDANRVTERREGNPGRAG